MRLIPFRCLIPLVCTLAVVLFPGWAQAQTHHGVELVHADLIADTTAIAPGKPFTVGLRLAMQPHWHTYWLNSGDAGLPTKITWQLPEGFKAGPIQWPAPVKIVSPGDIINYGYNDEVVLLTEITPPAQVPPGEMTLKAKADWLVCEDICVPGSAELSLKLPTSGDARAANADIFQKYRAQLPRALDASAGFTVSRSLQSNDLVFLLVGLKPKPGQSVEFFPLAPDNVETGHPIIETADDLDGDKRYQVRLPIQAGLADAAKVGGVLAITGGDANVAWNLPPAGNPAVVAAPAVQGTHAPVISGTGAGQTPPPAAVLSATTKSPVPAGSLWHFLLLGLLGGLILNVMPCVLPVISLKLFSFVKQANESPERVLRLGLAYAAGVFAWFLGFAALVVALQSAGKVVGYAFHLQSPWFLVVLSAVTFVFSLNLLGVFEIILPGGVTNALDETAGHREGYAGAFFQGVLATVLGSACTAPYFGEALGFAFSQSAVVIFAMFAAIAAGMSAPFVLLAAQPQWLRFLPKPGAWMERVKQATGFLMLATVLWLLWTLGQGRGVDAVIWTGALMLALGAACWVQGAFNTLVASDRARWISRGVIALLVLGGGWFCVDQIRQAQPPSSSAAEARAGGFAGRLDTALKTGRLVFVDFTADWCVNCKVNEHAVLDTEPIQKALQDRDALFLKADWTTGAEDITKLLRQFGRAGVPLYVIYPAGKPDAPVVMPELLSKQVVLDAFAEADHRAAAPATKPIAAR